jgi:hypothetical protein
MDQHGSLRDNRKLCVVVPHSLARGTRCAFPVASPPAVRRFPDPPLCPDEYRRIQGQSFKGGQRRKQRMAVASPVRWSVPAPPDTHHDRGRLRSPLAPMMREPSALPSTPSTKELPAPLWTPTTNRSDRMFRQPSCAVRRLRADPCRRGEPVLRLQSPLPRGRQLRLSSARS